MGPDYFGVAPAKQSDSRAKQAVVKVYSCERPPFCNAFGANMSRSGRPCITGVCAIDPFLVVTASGFGQEQQDGMTRSTYGLSRASSTTPHPSPTAARPGSFWSQGEWCPIGRFQNWSFNPHTVDFA